MGRFLPKFKAKSYIGAVFLIEGNFRLFKKTLPRLATHQLYQHVKRLRPKVHTWGICKIFMDVLKRPRRPEEVVNRCV